MKNREFLSGNWEFLSLTRIDMRKGINGLAMLVQGVLRQDSIQYGADLDMSPFAAPRGGMRR